MDPIETLQNELPSPSHFGIETSLLHPDRASLTVYLASDEFQTGQIVVIRPDEGYGGLSVAKEGHRVACFLNSNGISTTVLEHRIAPHLHPVPLVDAHRAIQTLRHHADD